MKRTIFFLLPLFLCVARTSLADERVSLEQFIAEAKGQNLSLKAKAASANAEQEGASGIRIPPPEASFIQMKMDAGSGSGFAIKQAIPFPTKITSEHGARQAEARVRIEEFSANEMETVASAKYLYFRLWETEERLRLLNEKAQIIEHHIKLARAVARSDSFLKIHVIKAENDLDLLKNNLLEAEQNVRERQIEAAEFLNHDPNAYRPIASQFAPSRIPDSESLKSPHQLEEKKFELEFLEAKESETKSKWLPDFNVQYKEMGATPMLPRYTEIMVGATLPFTFFWEPKAESGKAAAKRMEGQYLLEKEQRKIEAKKSTYLERVLSLKKQLDQFTNELLPRAEKRMKIVNNLAPRDMETLQDQRETLEAFPDLKLKALDVRNQYEKSIMELRKFQSGDQQ